MTSLFLDSNVIIEFAKNNPRAVELLDYIFKGKFTTFINGIVYSEVFFIFIKVKTGKSYWELKKNKASVKETAEEFLKSLFPMLSIPNFLEITSEITLLSTEISRKYGLLPNDALILATCKFYGIKYLISFDSDFENACKKEGIVLIDSLEKLRKEVRGQYENP
ncbi:MAG TPA: PIN domain-containing protein [Thermococcus litoralis]|uniref:PIN domain-containing protein n=1 Tax=Thermococcus litoralis TaxID=2265 RepID=A0A7C5NWX5_THELI|nr:PIN domain-containing protein [Thermococcus litoralis]